jgi:hypothetical protein
MPEGRKLLKLRFPAAGGDDFHAHGALEAGAEDE